MPFLIISLAVFARVIPYVPALSHLPHLPNFAPVAALALFSGVYLEKKQAYLVPLGAMLFSDYIIGFYNPLVMAAVYGCFVFQTFMGTWLKNHRNVGNLVTLTLLGSILFYLVTNLAVWAFPGSFLMYPKTLPGLLDCYIMGLPFFKNSVLGDLFYSGVFFGAYEIISLLVKRRANWLQSKI